MQPGGPVRQPYSYPVPSAINFSKMPAQVLKIALNSVLTLFLSDENSGCQCMEVKNPYCVDYFEEIFYLYFSLSPLSKAMLNPTVASHFNNCELCLSCVVLVNDKPPPVSTIQFPTVSLQCVYKSTNNLVNLRKNFQKAQAENSLFRDFVTLHLKAYSPSQSKSSSEQQ